MKHRLAKLSKSGHLTANAAISVSSRSPDPPRAFNPEGGGVIQGVLIADQNKCTDQNKGPNEDPWISVTDQASAASTGDLV